MTDGFWAKTKTNPDGCIVWTASKDRDGYGWSHVGLVSDDSLRIVLAHRHAFLLTHGKWPEPMCLHRCDNPSCVNPDHLYEGTHQDNMRDRAVRGRTASTLTRDEALEIRRLYRAGGLTQGQVGKRFGVSDSCVSRIVNGKRWQNLLSSEVDA